MLPAVVPSPDNMYMGTRELLNEFEKGAHIYFTEQVFSSA